MEESVLGMGQGDWSREQKTGSELKHKMHRSSEKPKVAQGGCSAVAMVEVGLEVAESVAPAGRIGPSSRYLPTCLSRSEGDHNPGTPHTREKMAGTGFVESS